MTEPTSTTPVDYKAVSEELRAAHSDLLKRSHAAAERNAQTIRERQAEHDALHERFTHSESERNLLLEQLHTMRRDFEAVRDERDELQRQLDRLRGEK